MGLCAGPWPGELAAFGLAAFEPGGLFGGVFASAMVSLSSVRNVGVCSPGSWRRVGGDGVQEREVEWEKVQKNAAGGDAGEVVTVGGPSNPDIYAKHAADNLCPEGVIPRLPESHLGQMTRSCSR